MSKLKTQAEIILANGKIRKFSKVYGGPGYPISPNYHVNKMAELQTQMDAWVAAQPIEAIAQALADVMMADVRQLAFPA